MEDGYVSSPGQKPGYSLPIIRMMVTENGMEN
jgi:hypothetical protein